MAMYYIYNRPPYDTTVVSQTFPEHHFPLEHTRHKVGHAISDFFSPFDGPHFLTPRADIRETAKKFYIDIELPGVSSKDKVGVKWTNDMTLLVDVIIKRPEINEDQEELSEADKEARKGQNAVHLLSHGRQIGQLVRSFYFSVEVEHETMEAKLAYGLLSIVVEKKPHEQKKAKTVEVEHLDS